MNIDIFGTNSHIACAGPTDGRPLLLVHGAANDRDAWHDIIRPLADAGIRVIVPDLPGHGLSGGKPLVAILYMLLSVVLCVAAVYSASVIIR